MHLILIAGASGVGALACVLAALRLGTHRVRRAMVPVEVEPPQAAFAFRILRTDEELGDALRRAALSERVAADAYRNRIERYETMLRPLVPIGATVVGADEAVTTTHPVTTSTK